MGIRLTPHQARIGYAAWMALLVAAHYAVTGARAGTSALIGVTAIAAMMAGTAVHRPARRAPWFLLAAAVAAAVIGGAVIELARVASHPAAPFPAFANGVYLVEYPLFVTGLALFIRSRTVARD